MNAFLALAPGIHATRVLSGDHRGDRSRHAPSVHCRRERPSADASHRLDQGASAARSFQDST